MPFMYLKALLCINPKASKMLFLLSCPCYRRCHLRHSSLSTHDDAPCRCETRDAPLHNKRRRWERGRSALISPLSLAAMRHETLLLLSVLSALTATLISFFCTTGYSSENGVEVLQSLLITGDCGSCETQDAALIFFSCTAKGGSENRVEALQSPLHRRWLQDTRWGVQELERGKGSGQRRLAIFRICANITLKIDENNQTRTS